MKKIISLLSFLMMIALSSLVYSATDDMVAANITINFPVDLSYTLETGSTDLTLLNATVRWNANTKNITNVSFIFTSGSTRFVFTNTTMNGTGGAIEGARVGDFTYRIQPDDLTANLAYTVRVEIRNSTQLSNDGAVNSSSLTYTLDSLNPSIVVFLPQSNEIVSSKGIGEVIYEYTPTDTNFGNSSLYIDGRLVKSSTSGTTAPNVTTGARNRFKTYFTANNLSRSFIIELTDLAGNKLNSTSRTFGVFVQGASKPESVFVTPSGQVISTPAEPKGKAITKPLAIGNAGNLLSNPFVWGTIIVIAVGGFIYWQNKKR